MYAELCAATVVFAALIGAAMLAALVAMERSGEASALLAAVCAAFLGSIAGATVPAWAARQPAQTFAAAALLSLGLRLMATLVAALVIQRVGGFGNSLLWMVGVTQFVMLGCDTAYMIGWARRIRGEK